MKISIITACYNSAATIQQTIDSVKSQKGVEVEHVIVDGGSKDQTVDILKANAAHITYISEPDKGIYDALNKGIKLATGDIIGTIGADDFYPSDDILSSVAEAFTKNPTEALYADKQYVHPGDLNKVVRYWTAGAYKKQSWLYGWMPPHLTFYLKKENFEKYGYYKTEFTCSGDYELMLRMLYKNGLSVQYLPKLVITMRTGGTSTASYKHRIVANKEDRKAWKINDLKPSWFTLWMKPISKITQFFKL